MPAALSDTARRLLDQPTYVSLSTVNPENTPQASSSGRSGTATTC